jgi:type 1 glutamine amidotransferase
MMIGEYEYETLESLTAFHRDLLQPLGIQATIIHAEDEPPGRNDFAGLEEALPKADLLLLSVRRRAPKATQLQAVRDHLLAGKPLVGIRTASHAFDARGNRPDGHAEWKGFDQQVLGAAYSGHYGDEPFQVEIAPAARENPLVRDFPSFESTKLYKGRLTSPQAQLLLQGRRPNGERQPIAWTHQFGPQQAFVFYTSLGVPEDFQQPAFRRLLRSAILQALGEPIPATDVAPKPSPQPADNDTGAIVGRNKRQHS